MDIENKKDSKSRVWSFVVVGQNLTFSGIQKFVKKLLAWFSVAIRVLSTTQLRTVSFQVSQLSLADG